jgi:hypothetical protein
MSKGFDVVIGNPPYGNILSDSEEELAKEVYETAVSDEGGRGTRNIVAPFLERSRDLAARGGRVSYIIPGTITRVDQFQKTRLFLFDEVALRAIRDEGQAFEDVTLEMITVFYEKCERSPGDYTVHITSREGEHSAVRIDWFRRHNRIILYLDELWKELSRGSSFGGVKTSGNMVIGSRYLAPEPRREGDVPVITGKGTKRFGIRKGKLEYVGRDDLQTMSRHLELKDQTKLAQTLHIDEFRVAFKPPGMTFGESSVIIYNETGQEDKALMLVLNSRLMDCVVKRYIFNYSELTYDLTSPATKMVPIKEGGDIDALAVLCEYLIFLSERSASGDLRDFLDGGVSDCLVYELYLAEKFVEDGTYPEGGRPLLEAVEPHLEPIEFGEWHRLYWKGILGGGEGAEAGRLTELTRKNEAVIRGAAAALRADAGVRRWMEVVRSHNWVRRIEGRGRGR